MKNQVLLAVAVERVVHLHGLHARLAQKDPRFSGLMLDTKHHGSPALQRAHALVLRMVDNPFALKMGQHDQTHSPQRERNSSKSTVPM